METSTHVPDAAIVWLALPTPPRDRPSCSGGMRAARFAEPLRLNCGHKKRRTAGKAPPPNMPTRPQGGKLQGQSSPVVFPAAMHLRWASRRWRELRMSVNDGGASSSLIDLYNFPVRGYRIPCSCASTDRAIDQDHHDFREDFGQLTERSAASMRTNSLFFAVSGGDKPGPDGAWRMH